MIKIHIRKKESQTAILISFDIKSDKFESNSERSKFFEELYGRRQIIRKQNKKYEYQRDGILNKMNYIKVDNSVFIIALEHMKRMQEFFKSWEDKVMIKTFPVILNKEEAKELERDVEIE